MTNHLWQSTWFALAAGLLTLAFRRNRAPVRYWLWLCGSLKFLLPFALLMSLGSRAEWAPAARQMATPAVSTAVVGLAQPFPDTSQPAAPARSMRDRIPLAFLAAWACGFAAIAFIRLRGWLHVRAIARCGVPVDLGLPVEARLGPGLLEPGVVGLWRPVLLLPAGIEQRLDPRQLEAILAHELAHIRRRDNWTAAAHMFVEAVFWFHPLVWWIGARLVEERERACDEAVLALGSDPHDYAQGILSVCKLYVESPLACVAGVTGADLKRRIAAILAGPIAGDLTTARKAALTLTAAAALAAPVVIGMMMTTPATHAQFVGSAPKFEVASIKPCKPGDFIPGDGKNPHKKGSIARPGSSPGRLVTPCDTVTDLIRTAYIQNAGGETRRDPSAPPVTRGPAWIQNERYQITAKAESKQSLGEMNGPMLQALLEERFRLRVHHETREVPVYALTVAKGGPKLQPFQEGSCNQRDVWRPMPPAEWDPKGCQSVVRMNAASRIIEAHGVGVEALAKLLFLVVDRPVVNQTGIAGNYDIRVEFEADRTVPIAGDAHRMPPPPSEPPDPSGAPTIFTALQQQLGLKLEPAKGPRDFVVIDHVERPSGN
jgi:uncharacterized protein (TIGR03435 family)